MALTIFLAFVGFTLALSFYLGRRAKSSAGYFAAHGQIGWFVNGVAFAGDYLSAASFLGICGMIAFYGYDGFLYSIGFLAGWVVALFVIAEPIKRLGKYTFADALNAKFGSRGITLAAAISTLVVSIFYLIPQMVGAGALIKPLLSGIWPTVPHWAGVCIVGAIVILIVTTAGMVSTTWVQFIKGSLLVVFCLVLVVVILQRGVHRAPKVNQAALIEVAVKTPSGKSSPPIMISTSDRASTLNPISFINELAASDFKIVKRAQGVSDQALREIAGLELRPPEHSDVVTVSIAEVREPITNKLIAESNPVSGSQLLLPGNYFVGIRSPKFTDRLDFISLMLALFCGTASLPHILIRYYTVKDASSARKSTVVGIGVIGFFYILTLFIGLGAMVSGVLDPTDQNMAAPLLAKSFNEPLFAAISAIAFTTVLGTVSGLILAAAGAVAHDLAGTVLGYELDDRQQVKVAKIAAVVVGLIAIALGIVAKGFNVAFLVAWAFNVAASANLPALVMILFWRGTTRQGVIASIVIGLISSLAWLLVSAPAMTNLYGVAATNALVPFSQPGLVTIPLSFATLFVVSLATRGRDDRPGFDVVPARGH